jgi:hypothetical protein
MVERAASSEDALDRSPKRTQVIDILSDSDLELPNVDLPRLTALSQRARKSSPGNPMISRHSWLSKPETRGDEIEENDKEDE